MCGLACTPIKSEPKKADRVIKSLPITYWHWHTEVGWSDDLQRQYDRNRVQQVIVRGGTLSTDGERMTRVVPAKFQPAGKGRPPIILAYNMDTGALKNLESVPQAQIADLIAECFRRDKDRAEKAGWKVIGLQTDFDYPTRLLPEYAKLLADLRERLPTVPFSMTGLQSWMGSTDFRTVADAAGTVYMQFYEGGLPRTLNADAPLSDLSTFRDRVDDLEALGVRYWVGIPAYSQTLLYDTQGKLVGTYRGLSVLDAARNPNFQLVSHRDTEGNVDVRFRALRNGANGRGKGYTLVYRYMLPKALRIDIHMVEAFTGPSCLGIAIFRAPEVGEATAIWPEAIFRRASLSITPVLVSTTDPADLIEGAGADLKQTVRYQLQNAGEEATAFGPGTVTVSASWDKGRLLRAEKGDFDTVTTFRDSLKSSAESANRVEWTRAGILPYVPGPELELSVEGEPAITFTYRVVDTEGKIVTGTTTTKTTKK